jgi:hypothetical protein
LVAKDGGLGGASLSPIVALALGKSLSPFDEAWMVDDIHPPCLLDFEEF